MCVRVFVGLDGVFNKIGGSSAIVVALIDMRPFIFCGGDITGDTFAVIVRPLPRLLVHALSLLWARHCVHHVCGGSAIVAALIGICALFFFQAAPCNTIAAVMRPLPS